MTQDWPLAQLHDHATADRLARAEWMFLGEAGLTAGKARHLTASQQSDLIIDIMTQGAVATSEISGELLDQDAVESSIRRQMGMSLEDDCGGPGPAESGAAGLVVAVARSQSQPVNRRRLEQWHELISPPDHAALPSPTPRRRIHRWVRASRERGGKGLEQFLHWYLDDESPQASSPLLKAAMAHLWLETLHPFPSCNGRLGRALAEVALMQDIPVPNYLPLSPVFLKYRQEYYSRLDAACRDRNAAAWLDWFSAAAIEAVRNCQAWVDFSIRKTHFFASIRDRINVRQEAALQYLLRRTPDMYAMGITSTRYAAICSVDAGIAAGELRRLEGLKAVLRSGAGSSARYRPNLEPPHVKRVTIEDIL